MGKTAVVILNYNGVDYLRQFLQKVIECSPACQVVVIDNNSTDTSVSFVRSSYPEIQLIVLPMNYGFSGGYNRGLKHVEAENYILLNSDVEVTPGWVDKLTAFMESHAEVAVCQPKILSYKHQHRFDYAGAAGGFLDILGYPFCRGRIFNYLEPDQGQYDNNRMIFWAGGACFFIRAKIYHQLGGLDEDFFAHMEEIDLCWRVKRSGYQIAYVGESCVFHLGGGTLKDTNPMKTYLNFRNGLQLLVKNSSVLALLWKLPLRILLDFVASMRFLGTGSVSHFRAVVKAEIQFLWTFPQTWDNRQGALPYCSKDLYPGFIIWDYFVRGKKTFDQIVAD
jgi:GT2 family glycosyltransferase